MTNPQRITIKIWPVLVEVASEKETITYTELVRRAGLRVGPRFLRPYLDRLQEFCLARGYPNLSAIVVRKDTGKPGRELPYPHGGTWVNEVLEVWKKNWNTVDSPAVANLRP